MVNYSQLIGEALVTMERPSMVNSPSGGGPKKAPGWDLADTEGYSSGNSFSVAPLMVSGYIGIYRRKKYVGGRPRGPRDRGGAPLGGRPPISWVPRRFLDLHSRLSGSDLFQK